MRFFTPDLLERYASDDPAVAGAADAEWEAVNGLYSRHIQALEPSLPPHIREFQSLLLHDAKVQSLARDKGRLILILKKDVPPRDLVLLAYDLEGEPVLLPFARRPRDWQEPTWFDFDEFDWIEEGGRVVYTQSIVFGNGWEMQLRFRDVQVTLAEPWTPTNGATSSAVSQTAS
jgi:hypothetical protein